MFKRSSLFCCCAVVALGLPIQKAWAQNELAQASTEPSIWGQAPRQAQPVQVANTQAYSEERPVLSTHPFSVLKAGTVSAAPDYEMPATSWAQPAASAPLTVPATTPAATPDPAAQTAAQPSPQPSPYAEAHMTPVVPPAATVRQDVAAGSMAGLPPEQSIVPSDMLQVAGVAAQPALPDSQLAPSYKNSLVVRASAPKIIGAAGPDDPVDLEADNLSHDSDGKIITAAGHVVLKQSGRELRADQVVYNMTTDTVTAAGHVIFTDESGDVHFVDRVMLTNKMKDGTVSGLKTYLARGGRFTAEDGKRENATLTTMNHATYTTCDCAEDAHGNAPWQISAKKMVYDQTKHRVAYNNATVGVLGVPVLWTPYFSHPDGQIKQQSGFLTPSLGYSSRLGANVTEQYYWGISPDKDATIGSMVMTNKNPLLLGEYRQRFDNAQIKFNGSVTESSYADQVGSQTVQKDSTVRSHIFGDGLWDMSNTWRSGFHLALASDDEYLRQYRLNTGSQNRFLTNSQDVLENEIYAERFSGRDYTSIRALAFQDIRSEADKTVQPSILPEISARFIGEPNETLGGRWDANVSAMGLMRDGNGQDVDRFSIEGGWQRRLVTGFGLVTTADARVRGDMYRIGDADASQLGSAQNADTFTSRLYPDVNIVSSYPFAKAMERAQIVISPEVSVTAAPNLDPGHDNIPNEDSQDVQLDATNIFQANRFPGYDRVESGSHVAYGVRTGVHGYEGSSGEIFLGQSYSLNDNTIFPKGSGLSERHSDIVGEISGNYMDHFGVDYRFDLTSDSLQSERHEFDGYANFWRFQLSERYLYAKALEDTNIVESRQQLDSNVAFRLTNEWKLRAGAVYDMGQDEGLRRAALSADYLGCCMFLSFTASRNFTTDASESNGTDFLMRIGLKGLGYFPTANATQLNNSRL